MKDFKLKLELRIDWSEIDLFGHVNNLAILKFTQAARVNYLERIGLMQLKEEEHLLEMLLKRPLIQEQK
jgi:acyl-CoA thioester hydrolase